MLGSWVRAPAGSQTLEISLLRLISLLNVHSICTRISDVGRTFRQAKRRKMSVIEFRPAQLKSNSHGWYIEYQTVNPNFGKMQRFRTHANVLRRMTLTAQCLGQLAVGVAQVQQDALRRRGSHRGIPACGGSSLRPSCPSRTSFLGFPDADAPVDAPRVVAHEAFHVLVGDRGDDVLARVPIGAEQPCTLGIRAIVGGRKRHFPTVCRLTDCLSLCVHFLKVSKLNKRPGTSCQVLLSENLGGHYCYPTRPSLNINGVGTKKSQLSGFMSDMPIFLVIINHLYNSLNE